MLGKKQEDGGTLRDHLNMAYQGSGIKHQLLLDEPELSSNLTYLWQWFCELDLYRGSNGFGANPITPTDIKDWSWLEEVKLERWEIKALKLIDNEYLKSTAESK